jgi:hypothetical protein
MEAKQSFPFFLKAVAQNDQYENISHGSFKNLVCENKEIPYFASNVSLFYKNHPTLYNLNIQPGSVNLSRLCQHLHKEHPGNTYFPQDLGNLELIYLHNMNLSSLEIESLPTL